MKERGQAAKAPNLYESSFSLWVIGFCGSSLVVDQRLLMDQQFFRPADFDGPAIWMDPLV
jgi:hypothetical protein